MFEWLFGRKNKNAPKSKEDTLGTEEYWEKRYGKSFREQKEKLGKNFLFYCEKSDKLKSAGV